MKPGIKIKLRDNDYLAISTLGRAQGMFNILQVLKAKNDCLPGEWINFYRLLVEYQTIFSDRLIMSHSLCRKYSYELFWIMYSVGAINIRARSYRLPNYVGVGSRFCNDFRICNVPVFEKLYSNFEKAISKIYDKVNNAREGQI